ncbi:hypothetical protein BDP27DRAFT_1429393 [Rhodocollybia butyracea]|uniref:C2H2-type domain-containing protein n=1 Tax=Rhodocollybia butyracea TaxID=206335 RepID=A0A9P5PF66_9AGAR|nr:hypothetical protein BDP27DRAFT_1429393 [Rhodocollybia butyracea]
MAPEPIKCPVCYREFSVAGYLERHIKQTKDDAHKQEFVRQERTQIDRISKTIKRVEALARSRLPSHAQRQPLQQPNDNLKLGSNEAMHVDLYNINDQEEYSNSEDEDDSEDEDSYSNFGLDPGYGDETDHGNSDIGDDVSDCPSLLSLSNDESDSSSWQGDFEDDDMPDVLMEPEAEAGFDFLPPLKPASPNFPDYSTSGIHSDPTYPSNIRKSCFCLGVPRVA